MRDTEVVGEAIRVEYSQKEDKLYLVFEIKHPKYKQSIKRDWVKDIEFKIIGKELIIDK